MFSVDSINDTVNKYLFRKNKNKHYFPKICTFLRVSDKKIEVYSSITCKHKWGEINYEDEAWEYTPMLQDYSEEYTSLVYSSAAPFITVFYLFLNIYGYQGLDRVIKERRNH